MQIVGLITEYSTILDALALVSSLMMIFFLMRNRRKYGRMFLDASAAQGGKGFAGEISQQPNHQLRLLKVVQRSVVLNLNENIAGNGIANAASKELVVLCCVEVIQ